MKKIKQIVTIFAALALAVTAGLSFAGTKTKAAGSDEFTRTAIEIAADMGYGWNPVIRWKPPTHGHLILKLRILRRHGDSQ